MYKVEICFRYEKYERDRASERASIVYFVQKNHIFSDMRKL